MLFNSFVFLFVLLPLSIVGYYMINKTNKYIAGLIYLLVISFGFVGYMNYRYLEVLIPSIVFNYLVARTINSDRYIGVCSARKLLLSVGIIADVSVLLWFKYYNFFASSINKIIELDIPTVKLILPLGISFYTFQQVAYLVDCYRDKGIRYGFVEYAVFITFYPQFIQGPIVLQEEFIPQILDSRRKSVDYDYLSKGIYRFILGLAKKVLIADYLGLIVDGGYANIDSLNSISAIILVISYSLQIYYDFSGYTDMAIGIGYMFHIDIPENFDSPYKARSIEAFWDRWHITLTRFFTRYIYIPLGGSRKGLVRTYINILVVFMISGLWHGAEWSFVLWGIMHGLAMIVSRMLRYKNIEMPEVFERIITYIYVSIAWVFFRATDIKQAWEVIGKMFSGGWNHLITGMYENIHATVEGAIICRMDIFKLNESYNGIVAIMYVIIVLIMTIYINNTRQKTDKLELTSIKLVLICCLGVWSMLSMSSVTTYVYWNF